MIRTKRLLATAVLIIIGIASSSAQDNLREGFLNPPREYRPRVWWHWMNGNITRDGIRKDMEWMSRAGIVGFHNFDAGMETPQLVDKRLPYMTQEWKEAFNYMLDLADSLDMEVSIASSPGWSCTGGPWVDEDDAMKKLCWSTVDINGGAAIEAELPEPMRTCGFYQDIPAFPTDPAKFNYFKEIAVIAVKLADKDLSMSEMGGTLTSSDGSNVNYLADGSSAGHVPVQPGDDGFAWICCTFHEPRTVSAFTTISAPSERTRFARCLEYSEDGQTFYTIIPEFPQTVTPVKTFDFTPVTARYFRLRSTEPGQDLDMCEFTLSQIPRVNMGAEKAGFYASAVIGDDFPTPYSEDAVNESDIIDITSLCGNGMIRWNAPEGRWRVFRFGYSLTGKMNGPASPEARGLEVDKFDPDAVRRYYTHYLGMYQDASRGRLGSVIKYLMIDSYEAKCQTWTASMPEEFRARRGYDLKSWLPALTGIVIGSSERTERFLEDWRLTLGELLRDYHYDSIDSLLAGYGMGRHTESHGYKRTFVSDGMDLKRNADIPMSEFWVRSDFHSSDFISEADIRESSSVCHIYGQKVCAAESFTADGPKMYSPERRAWCHHPGSLKPVADGAMASGVNRFIIHTSVHQPDDFRMPGIGLGKFGQWFTRKETWAEEARAWTDYLARSSFMLSQGEYVADIAYYFGETTNVTGRFMDCRPDVPAGYAYDFVNRTALLEVLEPRDGKLVSKVTGMSYRVLALDKEALYMSTDVLRRIKEIADAGVLVVGNEPATWCDLQGSGASFETLVRSIWHSGRANVIDPEDMESALRLRGIVKDADIAEMAEADVRFIHRHLKDGEMYWIANLTPEYRTIAASLNVSGFKPEIWHADTGVIEPVSSYMIKDGRTTVNLEMSPDDSQFIIFRQETDVVVQSGADKVESRQVLEVNGPWQVSFQAGRGAPDSVTFEKLERLDHSEISGIKYFSGTASYSSGFRLKRKQPRHYVINLGEVHDMARVFVNGLDMGIVWKEPFVLDVTDALRKGINRLEIQVTNTWVNRVIGDAQPGIPFKVTWTPYQEYTADDPLLPSGLAGPVILYLK